MSTWEQRMAERAAVRRMLREAEAYANDGEAPTFGGCGFEMASGPVSVTPTLPPDLSIGDHIYFFVNGKAVYHRIVGDE